MTHHHIYLAAMIWFLVGNALHGLAQINDLAQKNKTTLLVELQARWIPLLVRAVFSMFLFLAFLEGQLDDIVTGMHIPVPQWLDYLLDLKVNSPALAGLAGYAFDSALGYIPFIQKIGLPPAIDSPLPQGVPIPPPDATIPPPASAPTKAPGAKP